jgi:RNA polymerase sigma factor (sigma-70 family)
VTWTKEEELYRANATRMMALAAVTVGPSSAADVVSTVVLDLLKSNRWVQADDPAAYAMRAIVLASRMHLRSEGRRGIRERRTALSEQSSFEQERVDPAIAALLSNLSAQQRAVIYLTYWEDLLPVDVAKLLGVSDGAVRRQLARARAQLRKQLV